jgi:hypothetical protein
MPAQIFSAWLAGRSPPGRHRRDAAQLESARTYQVQSGACFPLLEADAGGMSRCRAASTWPSPSAGKPGSGERMPRRQRDGGVTGVQNRGNDGYCRHGRDDGGTP